MTPSARPIFALFLLACLALCPALPRPASGQDTESLRHAARAGAAEADEDWATALQEYSAAFEADSTSNYLLARVVHCLTQLGRDDEVMTFANLLWKRDSTIADAASDAGQMAFVHGRMDEASWWMKAATRSAPGDAGHWIRLGLVYEALQRPADAGQSFQRALEDNPDEPLALYKLALSLARRERESEALEPLRHLASVAPDFPHAQVMLGQVAENTGHLDVARDAFQRASEQTGPNSDREEGLRGTARVAFLQGRPGDAVAPLTRLMATRPDDTRLRGLRLDANARAGRYTEALADLDTLGRAGNDPEMVWLRSRLLIGAHRVSEARDLLKDYSDKNPGSWRAHQMLSNLAMEEKRYDRALPEARTAVELAPDSAAAHYQLGLVCEAMEHHAAAESAFADAGRLDSTSESAFFGLGVARERQGKLGESEAAFREVLRRNPRNASARNYVGYMYADRGLKLDESLKEITQALAEEPDNPAYLDSKGWVLFRLGRWSEAKDALQQAIRQGGRDAIIREHLGDVLSSLKLYPEARAAYNEALGLDPANSSLKDKLEKLKKLAP